jgi:VanZ family protein
VIARFAPPLALMALIWFLSAQPDLHSGLDDTLDLVLRKLAHMAVFGALLVAWWRAVGPRFAVLVTLAYAAVDEWHQTWVEGRVGAVSDWAIDAAGAAIAAALVLWTRSRARRTAPATDQNVDARPI